MHKQIEYDFILSHLRRKTERQKRREKKKNIKKHKLHINEYNDQQSAIQEK